MKKQEKKNVPATVPATNRETVTPEVMSRDPLASNMSEEQMSKVKQMMMIVTQDVANAELGKFYALRAGIGLVAVKGYFEHGKFEAFKLETFKGKCKSTLNNYENKAKLFFERYNTTADKVWAAMFEIDGKLIDRAASQLLITDGRGDAAQRIPSKDIPKIIKQMAEFIGDDGVKAPPTKNEPKKALTDKERRVAALDFYQELRSQIITATVEERTWTVLDVEDVESFASSLRTASEEMMRFVRKTRQAEEQKKG
jgi:hypothetical protein